MLTVIDEHSLECLAIVVERRLQSDDVLECLAELFVKHGPPEHIRSDNGSEFTAKVVPNGSNGSGCRRFLSNVAVLWRTVISRVSMARSERNCSMVRFSIP